MANVDYYIDSVTPVREEDYYRSQSLMIFFDTNIVIDMLLENERFKASHRLYKALEKLADTGFVELYTSIICIVEIVYQLGDLVLFKHQGDELIKELVGNIDNIEAIRTIIKNSVIPNRSKLDYIKETADMFKKYICKLEEIFKAIKVVGITDQFDIEYLRRAYRNNIQIQDLLVLKSAVDIEADILFTNDERFQKRADTINEIERYIKVRSLSKYEKVKVSLRTLKEEAVISDYRIKKITAQGG